MHGAVTHFPVALLITAFIYDAGAMVLHRPAWRTVSFWMLVAAVLTAVPSLIAGWITGNELLSGCAQPPAVFVWHRAAALTTSGVALLLLLWRAIARDQLAGGARVGSVALALVAAGVVGYTGYLGGVMTLGSQAPAGPAVAAAAAAVPNHLVAGRQLFEKSCAGCHGAHGGGQIGPMLAARYLPEPHIRTRAINGRPPMMPAFGKQFSPADIKAVTAYVYWLSEQK
jgi:mono/diheme cytochrome c family protein